MPVLKLKMMRLSFIRWKDEKFLYPYIFMMRKVIYGKQER